MSWRDKLREEIVKSLSGFTWCEKPSAAYYKGTVVVRWSNGDNYHTSWFSEPDMMHQDTESKINTVVQKVVETTLYLKKYYKY